MDITIRSICQTHFQNLYRFFLVALVLNLCLVKPKFIKGLIKLEREIKW